MGEKTYNQHLATARRIIANAAKPDLQKLLTQLYGNPPTEKSLKEDHVVASSLLEALQIWWARQAKLALDPGQIRRPTPTVVRVLNTGYEEDAILKDWGGLLHRAKVTRGKGNLVHFVMWDYFAKRWTVRQTRHAIEEQAGAVVRIRPEEQKWVKQKAPADAWTPDGGMRLGHRHQLRSRRAVGLRRDPGGARG